MEFTNPPAWIVIPLVPAEPLTALSAEPPTFRLPLVVTAASGTALSPLKSASFAQIVPPHSGISTGPVGRSGKSRHATSVWLQPLTSIRTMPGFAGGSLANLAKVTNRTRNAGNGPVPVGVIKVGRASEGQPHCQSVPLKTQLGKSGPPLVG